MSTYGQLITSEIDEALDQLDQYIIEGYDETDIKNLLSKIASLVELFLKRDVFPAKNNKDNFYSFTEQLKLYSISQNRVDFIHNIRLAYNNAKHNPDIVMSILQVKELLQNLKLTIIDIVVGNIGQVGLSVRASNIRVFWICAWDHYINGETEVAIFLPSEYDGFLGAHSIDHVSIYGLKWDNFKTDLSNFGEVYSYEGLILEDQVKFWLSEGDCLTPFVFEGEYSSLIVCLSKYLKDVDLISGLAREDDPINLLQTAVMAVSDSYANNPNVSKELQCISSMTLANNQYAVLPKFNERIEYYISKVVNIINQTPLQVRSALTGPIWVTKENYDSDASSYRDDDIRTLIDSRNRIVLGIRRL